MNINHLERQKIEQNPFLAKEFVGKSLQQPDGTMIHCILFNVEKKCYRSDRLLPNAILVYYQAIVHKNIQLHTLYNSFLGPRAPVHLEALSDGKESKSVTLTWSYPDDFRNKPFNGDFTVVWCKKNIDGICQVDNLLIIFCRKKNFCCR